MKIFTMMLAVCLLSLGACVSNSSNEVAFAQDQEAKQLLAEKTRELATRQDANARDKAVINNLRNAVGQQENVLYNIENPATPKAWSPKLAETTAKRLLDLKFEQEKNYGPSWASIAKAPDGLPALKIAVDPATKLRCKGRNCLTFVLPAGAAGKRLVFAAKIKGEDIVNMGGPCGGGKFMCHYAVNDKSQWPDAPIGAGTFDWKEVRFAVPMPRGATGAFLALGLQGATGAIYFRDVTVDAFSEN